MCRNLKFLTAEKIRFKKILFTIGPVVFAPDTQTYATELKKITSVYRESICRICLGSEVQSTAWIALNCFILLIFRPVRIFKEKKWIFP
jgi:hypothetical protein